jgi:galactokinase
MRERRVEDPGDVARRFREAFGRKGCLFRAPGRVNLIGEHTDYNDGYVMPMAIDRSTWVAAAARADRTISVRSDAFGETQRIDLEELRERGPSHDLPGGRAAGHEEGGADRWSAYVAGVAAVLDRAGPVCGADLLIASEVPIGAGLSSSAALEVAVGLALSSLSGLTVDSTDLALACQRAEHEFAGTRCGVMDQMIACHGRAGTVLLLDTRTLGCDWVPLPSSVRVVVCNTMVAHELATAEYNRRRADCEAGVAALAGRFDDVRALRDASLTQLLASRGDVSDRVFRRCRHVIAENARVLQAAAAFRAHDYQLFGRLMGESHASLRDDYEVSCPELDLMTSVVSSCAGVCGARMTGGGFGGCVVAIVDTRADEERLRREIRDRYAAATGLVPDVWFSAAASGATAWGQTSGAGVAGVDTGEGGDR